MLNDDLGVLLLQNLGVSVAKIFTKRVDLQSDHLRLGGATRQAIASPASRWERRTLIDVIQALKQARPGASLFLPGETATQARLWSYRELYQQIVAYMEVWQAAGVTVGTRVIFPFETTASAIFGFLALIGLGALPFIVQPYRLGQDKTAYGEFLRQITLRHQADWLLATASLPELNLDLKHLPLPSGTVKPPQVAPFAAIQPTDLAFVQFASSGTVSPQGIPVTHDKLVAQLSLITRQTRRQPEEVTASWLPLYHDMGLIGSLLTALDVQQDLHLGKPLDFLIHPVRWLQYLSEHRIHLAALPDFGIDHGLRALAEIDPEALIDLDLSQLRWVSSGCEPLNLEKLNQFCAYLVPFGLRPTTVQPCYGLAEAVWLVASPQPLARLRVLTLANGRRAVSVGRPMPNYQIRLRRETGELCQEGEVGEIELRGGTLVDHYFEDATPFYHGDGFFPTGELGLIDQGELFVLGRISDRILIQGQSYFAQDFEQAVAALPFGQPGQVAAIQTGDQVLILIEGKPASTHLIGQYQQQVSEVIQQRTGVPVPPENVLFIRAGQLPKTSSGKLFRSQIAATYRQGHLQLVG